MKLGGILKSIWMPRKTTIEIWGSPGIMEEGQKTRRTNGIAKGNVEAMD
jgi:hypothetical protein